MRTNKQIIQYITSVYKTDSTTRVNWPGRNIQELLEALLLRCFDLQNTDEMCEVLQLAEDHTIHSRCFRAFAQHPEHVIRTIGQEIEKCGSIGNFLLFLVGCLNRGTADITVISAHGCKGLTFDQRVVVVDAAAYEISSRNPDALNLLYVALTRGRRELVLATTDDCRMVPNHPLAKFHQQALYDSITDDALQGMSQSTGV
jgi:hypothetical protein